MMEVGVHVISNIGNIRTNHEDNFYVPKDNYIREDVQKKIKSNEKSIEAEYSGESGIFSVCDGMGGHNAGEVASRMAVQKISAEYDHIINSEKEDLLRFIKDLNNEMCKYGNENPVCKNMGSTFSALIVGNRKVHILHVGDSRIYCIDNNKLKQLTKDHTEGCRLVEAGIIKKEDLLKFPNRKLLYKYLGREGELVADCSDVDADNGARFIVSSDGLSDTLSNEEIEKIISGSNSRKDICQNLLKKCLEKGTVCNDNVTIICVDVK